MWRVWQLDHQTVGWICWILFFVGWETYTLVSRSGQELTAHLRPLWLTHSLAWWLAVGAWLWIGVHLLAPSAEEALLDAVTRDR